MYIFKKAGSTETKRFQSGDLRPIEKRDFKHRYHVFPLTIEQSKPSEVYLRLQTKGSMNFKLSLSGAEQFLEVDHETQLVWGVFLGIIFIVIIYNILMYFGEGNIEYIYYILYVFFTTLFILSFECIAYEYLWSGWNWWQNRADKLFAASGMLSAILFTRAFLNTKNISPRTDKILKLIIILPGFSIFATIFLETGFANRLMVLTIIPSTIAFMVAGARSLLKGYKAARLYLIAWMSLLLALPVITLKQFGILSPNFFVNNISYLAFLIEIIILMLALYDRIKIINEDKEKALQSKLEESRKIFELNKVLDKFIPHDFLNYLQKKSILDIRLGDSIEKNMNILFSDIRGFTSISENLTPEENFKLLNSLLKQVGPVIRNNGGFIDKYIGDAIMALFDGSPDSAVKAAIQMQRSLIPFNSRREKLGLAPIRLGIGINTGHVMLGTIGEHSRMESTVISDAVNLASRVEGLSKRFDTSLIITNNTYQVLKHPKHFTMREILGVLIRGKKGLYAVWEVLCKETDQTKFECLEQFNEGVQLYKENRFDKAYHVFKQCNLPRNDDLVIQYYMDLCQSSASRI